MLQCSQDPDDPLSYTCSWMAPTETNGELTGYELTCVPGLEGIPPPPVANPSMTSATVSYLRNGVNYTCSVSARNEGGLSLPSTTSFYTTEIGSYRSSVIMVITVHLEFFVVHTNYIKIKNTLLVI